MSRIEMHQLIDSVPAEKKVIFLDSCFSGALAEKGIKPAESFSIPVAEYDEPTGIVFLTATSGSDIAYEIDKIEGSLFTYHLVAGLYGQADGNRDGLVAVNELYQYSYRQMKLHSVSLPSSASQKPEYNANLKGSGALVLTSPGKSTSVVEIAAKIDGELTLVASDGLQSFTVQKRGGKLGKILLVPGRYRLRLRTRTHIGQGEISVSKSSKSKITNETFTFQEISTAKAVAKGKMGRVFSDVRLGMYKSDFTEVSPLLEIMVSAGQIRVERSKWQMAAIVSGGAGTLNYRNQLGTYKKVGVLIGTFGNLFWENLIQGQRLHLFFGGGADYQAQKWELVDEKSREFDSVIPKVSFGGGTSLVTNKGTVWGFSYRREWLFADQKNSDDVLAVAASLITFDLEF